MTDNGHRLLFIKEARAILFSQHNDGRVKVSIYDGIYRAGETIQYDPEDSSGSSSIVSTVDIASDGSTDLLRLDDAEELSASIMKGIYEQREVDLFSIQVRLNMILMMNLQR